MANAYSQLHNYDRELQTYDFDLIANVLGSKEQALAQGRAQVQQAHDIIGSIDLAKDQDNEYFNERYTQAKDIISKYSAGDLSDSNLSRQLVGKLAETVDDDRVTNAVVGTKRYRAEQQAWAKLREEEPDKFYEGNYALAQQNSQKWLNDGKTGSAYGGGGGVIEYDDYRARIQKELPEIMKTLNVEYVDVVPGSEYFRDTVTGKRVDPNKLEGALKGVIGEKGMKQMSIEAWYNYDKMDDATLEQTYTAYLQPKIDDTEKSIKMYQDRVDGAVEGSDKYNQAKANLDALKQNKAALKAREWGTLMATGNPNARKSAYTNMFTSQVIGGYVDAYSITSVNKIEANDNDVKRVEATRKFKELLIKEQAENRKEREFQAQRAKEAPGEYGYDLAFGGKGIAGQKVDVDATSLDNELTQGQTTRLEGLKSLRRVVGEGVNAGEIASIGMQMDAGKLSQMAVAAQKEGGKVEFTIGGNKVEIEMTEQNYTDLMDFHGKTVQIPPALKQWRAESMKGVQNISNNLSKQIAQDPEKAVNFPTFRGKIVEEEDGDGNITYALRGVSAEENREKSYYTTLLEKKGNGEKLTASEEKTLDMYTRLHLASDPVIGEKTRQEMIDHLRDDLANSLSNRESVMDILPATTEAARSNRNIGMSDMFNVIGNAVHPMNWFGAGGFGDALKPYTEKSGTIMEPGEGTGRGTLYTDPFISQLGSYDTDYEGEESSFSSQVYEFGRDMTNQENVNLSGMSTGITQNAYKISAVIAPKEYKLLAGEIVRLSKDKNVNVGAIQGEIELYRDLDETQTPNGMLHYSFSYKDKEGKTQEYDSRKKGGTPMEESHAVATYGVKYAPTTMDTPFAGYSMGEFASTASVGTSGGDKDVLDQMAYVDGDTDYATRNLYNTDHIANNILTFSNGEAIPQGPDRDFIKELADDYVAGNYEFIAVPVKDRGYVMQVSRLGVDLPEISGSTFIEGDVSSQEMVRYIASPETAVLRNYLVEQYIKIEKEKIRRRNL